MKSVLNYLAQGFASIGDGFYDIFQSWNKPLNKRVFKHRKIDLKKVLGRDLSDPNADAKALNSDMERITKDWEKVLGKWKK